jgi:D-alanyl-D-alanine carboxypeptidase
MSTIAARARRRLPIRTALLVAGVLAAGVVAAVLVLSSSDKQTGRPELQRALDGVVTGSSRLAPGATAYVSGTRGSWVSAAGLADVKTGERMRPDARMALDSVTKTWTSTLVLELVGEGRMRLDDTVERWLPGLLPSGDRITVEQLLAHTSGLITGADLGEDPTRALARIHDPALRAQALRLAREQAADPAVQAPSMVAVRLAAAMPLRSTPGTRYHYSNIGYAIAGMIAAKVSGVPLERLYRERIVEPLTLRSAAYQPQRPSTREYSLQPGGKVVDATGWYRQTEGADSGIVSNASDEGRFLAALMQGRLLRPAQLTAMLAPSIASGSSYGLGVEIIPTRCGVAYAHGGSSFGTRARVLVSRDGGRVAVLLLNGHVLLRGMTFDARADAAVDAAAERLYCAA